MTRQNPFRAALLLVTVAVALSIAGCAAAPAGTTDPSPTALGPSNSADGIVPEPGRTLDAVPRNEHESLSGYRIALVLRDDDAGSAALLAGATTFAQQRGATLTSHRTATADIDGVAGALAEAAQTSPDLVVGLGAGVVDAFAFETPQRLDQQFLVVGAQLAEPTSNVTAVTWDGATSRGSAAAPDGELDVERVAEQRVVDALGVGVAGIRDGLSGTVLDIT